jgi:hypothetical protein
MLTAAAYALGGTAPFHAAQLVHEFTFVMNGPRISASAAVAAALSPAVALYLSVDACAREFILEEPSMHPAAISFFEGFLSDAKLRVQAAFEFDP